MTSAKLELAAPEGFETPRDYVEKHLAPVAAELHRLVNEFLEPGSTSSEECSVDMAPSGEATHKWWMVDTVINERPKHVMFDGREYFAIPKESLRGKRLKVQMNATVFVKNGGSALFRLIRGDGDVVKESEFSASSSEPATITRILPFGEGPGCVTPHWQSYIMQARKLEKHSLPVCRRFSLSFTLI